MNASELASAMLEWEDIQGKADELAERIKKSVFGIGKTQTVGRVRATYSEGRKSYDYKSAWESYSGGSTPSDEYARVSWDYKKACDDAELQEISFSKGDPSVSLKLLKE